MGDPREDGWWTRTGAGRTAAAAVKAASALTASRREVVASTWVRTGEREGQSSGKVRATRQPTGRGEKITFK